MDTTVRYDKQTYWKLNVVSMKNKLAINLQHAVFAMQVKVNSAIEARDKAIINKNLTLRFFYDDQIYHIEHCIWLIRIYTELG